MNPEDSRSPGQDTDPGLSEYKAGASTRHSVGCSRISRCVSVNVLIAAGACTVRYSDTVGVTWSVFAV